MAIIRNITMANKDHLNLIITGHIDNGKSTTMGHFLMDLGVVDERTIQSHAEESEKIGKGDTFKYAWVMDNIKDERERGITIDLAFQKFESAKYFFTLIDAPGHRDFIKNMITGASEADCAVLVLSAKEGETDTAIAPGGQAREHAFLLKTLGVKQIIVAINKMDDSNYSEDAFKAAREKGEKLIKSVGYKADTVPFIPVSGWKGDNLVKKSENMSWYSGKTLLEAFDDFTVEEKPTGKPLRSTNPRRLSQYFLGTDSDKVHGWNAVGKGLRSRTGFSGNVKGMGPGVAELEFEERPNEAFTVFAADKTEPGAFNYPLYRLFVDSLSNTGLIVNETLAKGVVMNIMDVEEGKIARLQLWEDKPTIEAALMYPGRYVISTVETKDGEPILSASTDDCIILQAHMLAKMIPYA